MLRIEQYESTLRDLWRGKTQASDDDEAVAWDQAWSDMLCARTHALLVTRFEQESAGCRNRAATLIGTPGRARDAESARLRAQELLDIAARHREAAEEYQEKAETQMVECNERARQAKQGKTDQQNGEQQAEQQNGNGRNGQPQNGQPQGDEQQRDEQQQNGQPGENVDMEQREGAEA
jgi:hypothetical protein